MSLKRKVRGATAMEPRDCISWLRPSSRPMVAKALADVAGFELKRSVIIVLTAPAAPVHASNGVYAVLSTLTGFQVRCHDLDCAASRHIVDFLSLPTSLRDLAKHLVEPPVEPFAAEPVRAGAVVAVASDPKLESITKVIRTQIPSMCSQFHAGKSCCVEVSKHGRKYSGRVDCPNENGGFFIISAKEAKTMYNELQRFVNGIDQSIVEGMQNQNLDAGITEGYMRQRGTGIVYVQISDIPYAVGPFRVDDLGIPQGPAVFLEHVFCSNPDYLTPGVFEKLMNFVKNVGHENFPWLEYSMAFEMAYMMYAHASLCRSRWSSNVSPDVLDIRKPLSKAEQSECLEWIKARTHYGFRTGAELILLTEAGMNMLN
ncbi:hypothetical protein BJ741DRAFT_574624 [Chytriomyces cf. hyalinus JEL632]|nr:hypothetical protein BJ741DRAFT_574624 [Chytriomyces cf. hyalinus JEL632]